MKVSVILPNYNYEKYVSSRIDEILNQTYKVHEIIILDDGSTDDSVKVIKEKMAEVEKKCKNVKFITKFAENNSGLVFSQWQKGLQLASGDVVWIAEMDDSSSPKFLEAVMQPMKDKEVMLSYTNSKLIGEVSIKDRLRAGLEVFRKKHLPKNYVVGGEVELKKSLAIYNTIPNVSACVMRNVPELKKILAGASDYKLCGDWYTYVKLAKLGKIAYTNKKYNHHRLSKKSVTGRTSYRTRFKEFQRVHAEVLGDVKLPKSTQQKLVAMEMKLAKNWKLL